MIKVTAINEKHQAIVNCFVRWNGIYDQYVDQGVPDDDPKQERAWVKAWDYWSRLPRREQLNIMKHIENVSY